MRILCLRLSVITLALALALPALAAEGRTPVFLDGTVIAADGKYILTRDIVSGGAGPVIHIAASQVDLDLNGFTIFGTAGVVSIEIPSPPAPGIPQDIRIHNGFIVGGDAGIIRHPGPSTQRLVIEDIRLRDQGVDAIAIFDTVETVHIRRVSIRRTGANGIVIVGPDFKNGSIQNCSIKETVSGGIVLDTAAAFEISNNNLEIPGTGAVPGSGITLVKGVGCLISQNTISDPGVHGIELRDSMGNKIYNNVIRHAFTTGIYLNPDSAYNLVMNNIATDCGFDSPPGHGLHIESFQNHVHGNSLNGNWGCGLLFDVASFGNTFGRNMARGNGIGGSCPAPIACAPLFSPDSCDLTGGGGGNDTSSENMIPAFF